MNAKLSRQMTLLGLGVLAFYAGVLGTGHASLEILPQFAISAVIFLSSGKIMKQMAEKLPAKEETEGEEVEEPNWELRTLVLHWVVGAAVVSIVALFLVKPASMIFNDFGRFLLQMDTVITSLLHADRTLKPRGVCREKTKWVRHSFPGPFSICMPFCLSRRALRATRHELYRPVIQYS